MRVLITGGAGFIGSHLSDEHLRRGHKVHVLDNLVTGRKSNVSHLLDNPNFTYTEGNILDEHKLLADIEKLLQAKIRRNVIPGYEPDPRIKAEPITMERAQRFSGKKNWRSQKSSASSKGRNSGKRRSLARQA